MCGLVGFAGRVPAGALEKMCGLLAHRGPDHEGVYKSPDGNVGLAMRRLSILDLAGGAQPMPSADRRLWVVFNGEIFNFPELRAALEKDGRRFSTHNSDTEVLLHLYEAKKEAMLGELNGMFAFVIHDTERNVLFGARDRFGIKPFYYRDGPDGFTFSSELKSLLPLSNTAPEIDRQSLFHYLSLGYVPGGRSILSGANKLEPGHSFTYDLKTKKLQVKRYWNLAFNADRSLKADDGVPFIRDELEKAVRRWSLSDVPLGCSLSGGLDSSAVVALLAKGGYGPIRTYSLGFEGPGTENLNELPLAKKVAEKYGTQHHEQALHPAQMLADLVSMVWHLDEPYGGGLPSWYVFKFMAQDVKVGMTGTGGDEIFGDYEKFGSIERNPLVRFFHTESKATFEKRYFNRYAYMPDPVKRASVFADGVAGLEDTNDYLYTIFKSSTGGTLRNKLTHLDFQTQLPEEFLLMTDRFSMAHSLEARVPFLDSVFVEKMMTIPSSVRTRLGDPKYLLRRAVEDLLPPELLTAEKRGFVVPTALWLKDGLKKAARHLLAPERLKKQGLFQENYYASLLEAHIEGRGDFHKPLWFAFMFQLWHLVYIEGKATEKPTWMLADLA